jgi:hypothetical protein
MKLLLFVLGITTALTVLGTRAMFKTAHHG